MANDGSPDVRLNWPDSRGRSGGSKRPARGSQGRRTPSAPTPTPEPAQREPASSPRDERNLLRLRLPSDRADGTEIASDAPIPDDVDRPSPTAQSDLSRLVAEVARLRSEVNLLERRVENLELDDRHRTDVPDYAGDS